MTSFVSLLFKSSLIYFPIWKDQDNSFSLKADEVNKTRKPLSLFFLRSIDARPSTFYSSSRRHTSHFESRGESRSENQLSSRCEAEVFQVFSIVCSASVIEGRLAENKPFVLHLCSTSESLHTLVVSLCDLNLESK